MAYQTSAELLAGFNLFSGRPAVDEMMSDVQKYSILALAQEAVYSLFSIHFPEVLYEVPGLMTTADSGATYTFPSAVFPFGSVEIRSSRNGALLIPGVDWDGNCDYVWEGSRIRMPNGRTRTFANGPYARYIKMPSDISASQQPSLVPAFARKLILFQALYLWANMPPIAGTVNPDTFLGMFQNAWRGEPRIDGSVGIYQMLVRQGYGSGMSGISVEQPWYRGSPDLGN